MDKHRKLMILGINELLDRGVVSLTEKQEVEGHVFCTLAGRPSVINWCNLSGGELRISVWWDFDLARHPQANLQGNQRECFTGTMPLAKSLHYPKFLGAASSGWLERRTGAWIQGKGPKGLVHKYCRATERSFLEELPPPLPNGYLAEGKFFR